MQKYTLIRSKKRRRSISMKIDIGGEIVVSAPVLMPKFFIDRFVADHATWIEKQQKARKRPRPQLHPYFGTEHALSEYIKINLGKYSEITGLCPKEVKMRRVKTYWGSCSPQGVISFNKHLQYAPPEAIDYVIVHELCHLKYRGHGKRFWDLVYRHYPRANEMRTILRQIAHGDITD